MKKLNFLLFASLFLLLSCGGKDQFTLKGTLQNGAGKMVYLEELTPDGPLFIDSIRLDKKGSFSYKYTMPYESFYNLHASERDYIMLLPKPGETVEVTGDYERLCLSYLVQGSEESQWLWQVQRQCNESAQQLMEVVYLDRQNKASLHGDDSLEACHFTDSLAFSIIQEQRAMLATFIMDHYGSLATLIALHKPVNGNEPAIDPRYNLDLYEEVLTGLEECKPTNPHTHNFATEVALYRSRYAH